MAGSRKGDARLKGSRAREFDLMFACLDNPSALMKVISENPTGASVAVEGILFEFGNVAPMVSHMDSSASHWPFTSQPSHVFHLDNIAASRKQELERQFNLPVGSMTSRKSRADLYVRTTDNRDIFISVKDGDAHAKLGQVSSITSYGKASLAGGLAAINLPLHLVPEIFDYKQTHLSESRFSKLGSRDQKFAYIKKNHRKAWESLVAAALADADSQMRTLVATLSTDASSLIAFVSEITGGVLAESDDYFLLIGQDLVNYRQMLVSLEKADLLISSERHQPRDKISYIVWVETKGIKYGLTKIEASFEGARKDTEQTKGIIFHFQQFPLEGNHYKKLFLDLIK